RRKSVNGEHLCNRGAWPGADPPSWQGLLAARRRDRATPPGDPLRAPQGHAPRWRVAQRLRRRTRKQGTDAARVSGLRTCGRAVSALRPRDRALRRWWTRDVPLPTLPAGTPRMSVLSVQAVAKRFGERLVFSDISFRLAHGDRVGLVGPNGVGKATVLRMGA